MSPQSLARPRIRPLHRYDRAHAAHAALDVTHMVPTNTADVADPQHLSPRLSTGLMEAHVASTQGYPQTARATWPTVPGAYTGAPAPATAGAERRTGRFRRGLRQCPARALMPSGSSPSVPPNGCKLVCPLLPSSRLSTNSRAPDTAVRTRSQAKQLVGPSAAKPPDREANACRDS